MINKKRLSVILSVFLSIFLVAGLSNSNAQDSNVVEVINNSENHTVFADLLDETGLNDVVSQAGPYTVVAPTDKAFEEMDANLEDLRANSDSLESVVISHLFQGEVAAQKAEASLGIEIQEGGIEASNGLVHVVDEVIEN
ncbi:fasciclin domain-containing protein [Rhodohalobacter sulfatireducens]|uniref:Fasciclin domain-containing protein n=1 Tax=Rhodohalobacter sulfatireducens TaxID=2911366 RepID=A0ABS9KC76_9BACT|nr:fasciclin domain-containing protein [Rhodohalobacter sulfatireducens]MCG2588452.1 fasciclin domain-containing protein [Rhodohalobacter sulfatireducens]